MQLGFEQSESLKKALNIFKLVEEGTKFSTFMRQERYKAILYSSDAKKIRDVVVPYMTDARMYKTKFCKTVKAEENDLVIKVDHHESNELLQIKNGDTMLLADKGALKSGKTLQMIVKKGDTATVEFPVKP